MNKRFVHPAYLSLVILSLTFLSGCGSGDGKITVKGTVTFADGSPVKSELATILFTPDENSSNPGKRPANGSIDSEGKFELMTGEPGDGAFPGDYKVVLKVWKDYRSQTLAIPKQYSEPSTTPLAASISSTERNFDFVIEK